MFDYYHHRFYKSLHYKYYLNLYIEMLKRKGSNP